MEETQQAQAPPSPGASTAQQEATEERPSKLKRFIKEALRVLHITKKPNKEEYLGIVKVSALGIGILGALGFVVFLMKQLIFS